MATRTDDLAMVHNPNRWPCWPVLPVKRLGSIEEKDLGVILDGKGPTVYHVNLFDLPKSVDGWNGAAKTHYATVEAMLADGWVVD